MSGADLPYSLAASIHWLGRDSLFEGNAPLLAKCEIGHVCGDGGVVSHFNWSIGLLAARPDAIHPVAHVVHTLRFTLHGLAIGTVQTLGIIVDAGCVFARHHI